MEDEKKSDATEPPAESFDDDLTADEIMSEDDAVKRDMDTYTMDADRANWDRDNTQDRFE